MLTDIRCRTAKPREVETVRAALQRAGNKPLLFPGVRYGDRPITDSTLSKLYRAAGYASRHVPHGWRATFSTVMNELAGRENRVSPSCSIQFIASLL